MSVTLVNGHVLIPNPPNWTERPEWTRAWQSEIAEALTGSEDRGAMRQVPRVSLTFLVDPLSVVEQQRLDARLIEAMKSGKAVVPNWGHGSALTAPANGGTATVEAGWPWAVNDYVFFLDAGDPHAPVFNVRQVTGVNGNTLTLDAPLAQTFNDFAWPLLFGKPKPDRLDAITSWHGSRKLTISEMAGSTIAGASGAPAYLNRPIFTFPVNWADKVNAEFSYNLREVDLGFGAEDFAPTQTDVVHGFDLSLFLKGADFFAFDNFTAALKGRLLGFWLPGPFEAFKIAGGVSTTQFDIADQDLAQTLANHPSQYLWLTAPDGTGYAAHIEAVADNGATERVTISPALPSIPDAGWSAARLYYVRLGADEEKATLFGEAAQQRNVRVIELPREYTTAETGESPVYLYHFWMDLNPTQHWRYTSFAKDITSGGQVFAAKSISHGDFKRGTSADARELAIDVFLEDGHPLAFGFPYPSPKPVNVEVLEAAYATPDVTAKIFTGLVARAPRKGKKISARCVSLFDLDNQKLPDALIGPRCNFQVYEPNTCKVNRAAFQKAATISVLNGRTIRVTDANNLNGVAANWFAFGWIETGAGMSLEIRTVLQSAVISATVHELTLNLALGKAVVGQAITLLPGCDGKWATCENKFGNDRYMGHYLVPQKNPTLTAMQFSTSSGGKK